MTFDKILKTVQGIIENYSLDDYIKENNIHLEYDEDMLKNKDSVIISIQNDTCIFIKPNLNEEYEKFLILHELGHYVLHRDCSKLLTSSTKMEHEANMFACLWLINCNIKDSIYFDTWLLSQNVPHQVTNDFQDTLYQYKQTSKFGDKWLRMEI